MFWTYEYLQFDCNRNILYIKVFWVLHVKVEIYTIITYILEWNIFITYLYVYMHVYIYILFKHLHDSWVLENL